jgi:hypothetical protein
MPDRYTATDLDEQGRALVERLGGRWTANGGLCRCPAHDDRNPSLSIRAGRTRLLFHCFAGCDATAVLRALGAAGLLHAASSSGCLPGDRPRWTDRRASRSALRLWEDSRPIAGTPAERYLAARGIRLASPDLRFHPRTPHEPRPLTCFRPALIAAVRDSSGLVAVHRSFLDPRRSGLAGIDQPRCGLGRLRGGAVRLGGMAPRLGLAEGIETALSASILFGLPCWATLGTERFPLVELPPQVTELVLFLDNDPGGRRAEALARETFAQLTVEARYPKRAGDDWNDVLRAAVAGGSL